MLTRHKVWAKRRRVNRVWSGLALWALKGLTVLTVLTGLTGLSAQAQSAAPYPAKPIRLVIGYSAGGPTDLIGRLMAHGMEQILGQPIIVENKPGGGSNIASEAVAHATPDGYTLLVGTISNATNMSVYDNLRYDTLKDFVPVTHFMSSPSVLVVNPKLPVYHLKELIAYARANPGKLTYATTGTGGSTHFAGELLKIRAGIDLLHVPYKGASPAITDIMAGNVSMGFMTAAGVVPSVQAGKLRAIAVAGAKRLPQLPNVPTVEEEGLADFEVSSWNGLFAPAGTPPAIVEKLSQAALTVLGRPETQAQFAEDSAFVAGGSPEDFRHYVAGEILKWAAVAKAANIKLN